MRLRNTKANNRFYLGVRRIGGYGGVDKRQKGNAQQMTAKKRAIAPRKIPSQQRAIDSVERILAGAATLLDEKGYDHLTTISIAKQAGASIGSVYQYFPNKQAIMVALFERWLAMDNQALEDVEAGAEYESIVDEFLALTEKLVKNYRDQKGLLVLVNIVRNNPELYEIGEKHDKQYAKRLAKLIDKGDLKLGDDEKFALAGYFTILVDAVAVSIATETDKRANMKERFLMDSVRDLFERYSEDDSASPPKKTRDKPKASSEPAL